MNNDIVALLQELKVLRFEQERLLDVIDEINIEANALAINSSDDIVSSYKKAQKKCEELVKNTEALRIVADKWCEVLGKVVANNKHEGMPAIDFNAETLDDVRKNLDLMFTCLPEFNGEYRESDFAEISSAFAEQYRAFVYKENTFSVESARDDLRIIEDFYTTEMSNSLKKYQVEGDRSQFNVGGTVYIMQAPEDLVTIFDAIHSYEKEQEKEVEQPIVQVETVIGVPISQASPEIQAKFADKLAKAAHAKEEVKEDVKEIAKEKAIELKSGAKVVLKQFTKKGKEIIKLIGSKMVATSYEIKASLKNYYADINVANNVEFEEEAKALPAGEPEVIYEVSNEGDLNLTNELDDQTSIKEETFDNDGAVLEPAANENHTYTIDETLEGYVKTENQINNNSELTEEQKKQWRDALWSDFDKFVEQNPENSGVLEGAVAEPVVANEQTANMKAPQPEVVYNQKPSIIIEKMNEAELNEYINNLHLTMEEIERFNEYQKSYKENYAGMSDYMIRKACIKQIADQREFNALEAPKENEVDSKLR